MLKSVILISNLKPCICRPPILLEEFLKDNQPELDQSVLLIESQKNIEHSKILKFHLYNRVYKSHRVQSAVDEIILKTLTLFCNTNIKQTKTGFYLPLPVTLSLRI